MNELDEDALDLLNALDEQRADYLLVGAHALAAHGVVRATGDIDLWVRASLENSRLVYDALTVFGAPVHAHGLDPSYFAEPGRVYQIGLPPRRIDLLSSISGVAENVAFDTAEERVIAGQRRKVLSAAMLLQNKRATGRLKDLADAEQLERELQRRQK